MERAMSEFAGTGPKRRLTRRPEEGKIGGVCAGLADYFDADVALVRAAWVVLSIWPGAIVLGVIAYLAAWLIMPRADAATAAPAPKTRLVRSRAAKRIAGVCGGLAGFFQGDPTVMRVPLVVVSVLVCPVLFCLVADLLPWVSISPAP